MLRGVIDDKCAHNPFVNEPYHVGRAGEALEYGVILCTKLGDARGFERNVQLLRPFYASSR